MKVGDKVEMKVPYDFVADIDPILFDREPTLETLEMLKEKIALAKEAAAKKLPVYDVISEGSYFECSMCGMRNWGAWRLDKATNTAFKACGACQKVLEVKPWLGSL